MMADEVQALRYKDVDGLTIVEGASRMGVSKSVFGTLYKNAREKLVQSFLDGVEIAVQCPSSQ